MKKNIFILLMACLSFSSLALAQEARPSINEVVFQYMNTHEEEALATVLEDVTNSRQKNCLSKAINCSLNSTNTNKCETIYNQCMAKKPSSSGS